MFGNARNRTALRSLRPVVESCEARSLLSGAAANLMVAHPAMVSAQSTAGSKIIDMSKYAAVEFEATVTKGPHAGASIHGELLIQQVGSSDKIVGQLAQNGPIGGGLPNLTTIPVTGRLHNHQLTLKFDLGHGVTLSGTGHVTVGKDGTKHITLKGTGNLTGSTAGDKGNWSLVDLNQPFTYYIKIRNPTSSALKYEFGFLGTTGAKVTTTPAGFATTFTFNGTLGSRLTPAIRYDASFASGYQAQVYTLSTGNFLTTSGTTGAGVYKFVINGQNISFFKA